MKRLTRSRDDVKLGGVIAGLGEYFDLDSNLLRLATVALCFMTGIVPLLITYFIAWAILPEKSAALNMPGTETDK
ncbi:MAG: PspC domain-containing protein [Calditrichia bacterium]